VSTSAASSNAVISPFSQAISVTVTPPRARRPRTRPARQALGRAGSSSITGAPSLTRCDWTSISAIAAVVPKFPSIWNGGCAHSSEA
jgi:hypothetical protein